MNQLKELLAKYLSATNISVDPLEESLDLKKVFNEAARRGYLSKSSLQRIESYLK